MGNITNHFCKNHHKTVIKVKHFWKSAARDIDCQIISIYYLTIVLRWHEDISNISQCEWRKTICWFCGWCVCLLFFRFVFVICHDRCGNVTNDPMITISVYHINIHSLSNAQFKITMLCPWNRKHNGSLPPTHTPDNLSILVLFYRLKHLICKYWAKNKILKFM